MMQVLAQNLIRINESNLSVLLQKERFENQIEKLIQVYQELGDEYENLIHQVNNWTDGFRIRIVLENTVTIARNYLQQIQNQYLEWLSTKQLEDLEAEIDNLEELAQDVDLKFFIIPNNPTINEILGRL